LMFTKLRKFPPSVWGKISTFFQIAAALVVIGARARIPAPVTLALYLMVLGTIVSGIHYVWRAVVLLRQTAH
jgi:phosphatidylglycerophosphate synthase